MSAEDVQEIDYNLVDTSGSSTDVNLDIETHTETIQFIQEFDLALIKYISGSNRLFFADQPQTWQDFHTSADGYMEKFGDFSSHELCQEFIEEVLPRIYTFDLSATQVAIFGLLMLHNEYQQIEDGYLRIHKSQRLTASREPQFNVDYRVEEHTFRPPDSPAHETTSFTMQPKQSRSLHTVVIKYPLQLQQGGYGFRFTDETHALLSAALSNDFELSGCFLYKPQELHQRLRAAKCYFEQRGIMPENCLPSNVLLDKIHKLYKLRRALANLMDNMFL